MSLNRAEYCITVHTCRYGSPPGGRAGPTGRALGYAMRQRRTWSWPLCRVSWCGGSAARGHPSSSNSSSRLAADHRRREATVPDRFYKRNPDTHGGTNERDPAVSDLGRIRTYICSRGCERGGRTRAFNPTLICSVDAMAKATRA